MTPFTFQQKADAERQEADRAHLDALAYALLLGYVATARRAVFSALRAGNNPTLALQAVMLGSPRHGQPGLLPTLRQQMLRAYQAGKRQTVVGVTNAVRRAGVVVPPANHLMDVLNTPDADAANVRANDGWMVHEVTRIVHKFESTLPLYYAKAGAPQALTQLYHAVGIAPGNEWAVKRLAEQVVAVGYSNGRGRALSLPVLNDKIWGLTWRTMRDDRVRRTHRMMEGVTRRLDDPVWDVWVPPAGWNCRCVRTLRFKFERPVETPVPNVMPDPGFAGRGNVTLRIA